MNYCASLTAKADERYGEQQKEYKVNVYQIVKKKITLLFELLHYLYIKYYTYLTGKYVK